MIKARAGDVWIFGLSEENMRRLKEGYPIMVNRADLGEKGKVIIFYGKDEETMERNLSDLIGPDTKVTDTRRKTN